MAFLFASPRFLRIQVPPYEEAYAQIEYRQEFNELAKTMLASNNKIFYRHSSATVSALKNCFEMGVSFVHISCHGESETSQRAKMGDLFYNAYSN